MTPIFRQRFLNDFRHELVKVLHELAPEQSSALEPTTLEQLDESLQSPKQTSHGDLACNIAMRLAKPYGQTPMVLATALAEALSQSPVLAPTIEKASAAPPGFVNLRFKDAVYAQLIFSCLAEPDFGCLVQKHPPEVILEFVSANPTGPLHVGHGRQAALGDCLAAVLQTQGYRVTREFYYNDAGAQINNLATSVQARAKGLAPHDPAFPQDGYRGDYILDIAKAYQEGETIHTADGLQITGTGSLEDLDAIRQFAVAYLRREQDLDLKTFGVRFDRFSLESSLYADGHVGAVIDRLVASGDAYENEGALWLATTRYGDDKDRVMRKSDGGITYFVPDVAYHEQKFKRGCSRAINIQGSDHHGTVARVRAGLQALNIGVPKTFPEYLLHKMVTVMRQGHEVKISKRAGQYVTLRDLIVWSSGLGETDVTQPTPEQLQKGRDTVRFFLVSRKPDTEFVFDVDLAVSQTDENPVYYVQYAHARCCSVLAQAQTSVELVVDQAHEIDRLFQAQGLVLQDKERCLCLRMAEFPRLLGQAAHDCAPHLLAFYLRDLAADFHGFYNAHRVLVDDASTRQLRLFLVAATAVMLRRGLGILGVSSPDRM
ncbi:MAG: arginine--tRNA ligase [Burkholderiaceae bacterium]|nr:arginine--tRNA ligase [Burkholderiaceae bacterium]